jgi:hypothetical protein
LTHKMNGDNDMTICQGVYSLHEPIYISTPNRATGLAFEAFR